MLKHLLKSSSLEMAFQTEGLTPQQIRLLRTLNYALIELLTAENEEKFFEKSSELMKLSTDAIRLAHFSENLKAGQEKIPYAEQAIEFSIDTLNDSLTSRGARLDN